MKPELELLWGDEILNLQSHIITSSVEKLSCLTAAAAAAAAAAAVAD